jgi:AraC-like DNA-binding protein
MSQHAEGPVAESVRRLPAPALRPFVASYSGYRQAGLPRARHRGLPSPHLTLIITLDEPLTVVAHPDPRQPPGEYATLVGGLHTAPAMITHDGRQSGIQLGLTPLGARALLGMPAGELANIDVSGADVLGAVAAQWHERLGAAPDWAGRFTVLDGMLLEHARFDATVSAELAQAWRRLLAAGGRVSMSRLAGEVGWSPRHLGGRLQAETGLAPKAAARVVRFDRARRSLQRRVASGQRPALADLAATCGYFDQAHLAREFRALAGCPPSQWLAEEFRNVQAGPVMSPADS